MQAARGAPLTSSGTNRPPSHRTRPSGSRARLLTLFAGVAALGYATDLVTKTLAVARLTGRPPVHAVGDLLMFDLTRNPGAAFSTGTSYTVVLSFVAIVAACAVLWVSRRLGSAGWAVALGFLLAGVLGNLTDRVFRAPGFLHGHVVDFLQLPHWPVFNVADMCINVAAALIVIQALRGVSVSGSRARHPGGAPEPARAGEPDDPEAAS
jgi:signal peptidase II